MRIHHHEHEHHLIQSNLSIKISSGMNCIHERHCHLRKKTSLATWSRIAIALLPALFSPPLFAGEYYFSIDSESPKKFKDPDSACEAAYDIDLGKGAPYPDTPNPDPKPRLKVMRDVPPKVLVYSCNIDWHGDDVFTTRGYLIFRHGDNCKSDETYNPSSGLCESAKDEQDRKELGDPLNPHSVGFVSCGDPVNPANGNVYESEVDYQDPDGGLSFYRSYNSRGRAGWSSNFDVQLYLDSYPDNRGAIVRLGDGRTALFSFNGDKIIADGGEFGRLQRTSNGWSYISQDDELFLFDASGQLMRWEKPGGRFIDIETSSPSPGIALRNVTDHLGHRMAYTTRYGWPLKLVVDDFSIDYTVDEKFRVTEVKKTWPSHTSVRKYLYEDQRFPTNLTGIIDERGVRISTWTYDANSRATSAAMAGGVGKFSFAYDSPTQTTVTNPLGHPVKYGFAVVQGAKRIIAIDSEPTAGCPASNSKFTYTADAQLATQTNALGHVTAYTYDTLGRQTKQVEGQGTAEERTTSTTWDGTSFRPATVTTADRVTSYSYDAQGRPLSTTTRSLKD